MTDYRSNKPKIGDTCQPSELGLKGTALRIWAACPDCHIERWVRHTGKSHRCKQCSAIAQARGKKTSNHGSSAWINGAEPKQGDKALGSQIGRKGAGYFIWTICPKGDTNPRWNNGVRYDASHGFYVRVKPDHPFYQMSMSAGSQRYIAEHRLVVAMSIGRILEKWEVVHHINGNNTDNRLENLELLSSQTEHLPYNLLQTEVYSLRDKVNTLERRVTLLEADNTLLVNQLEDKPIPSQAENVFGRCRDLTRDTLHSEGEGKVHPPEKSEDNDA